MLHEMTWRSSLCFLILVVAVLSELPSTSAAADLICAEGYTQDPASGTCRSSSTLEQEEGGLEQEDEWDKRLDDEDDSDYGNESALELENELNVYNLL